MTNKQGTNYITVKLILLPATVYVRDTIFWNMTACCLLEIYQRFVGIYASICRIAIFYSDDEGNELLECTRLHDVTTQKTVSLSDTIVRTSNPELFSSVTYAGVS